MTHPLALSVINSGKHYDARCKNYRKMTARHYKTFILGLVTDQARHERITFNVKSSASDIVSAVEDVLDHMQAHMLEMEPPVEPRHG